MNNNIFDTIYKRFDYNQAKDTILYLLSKAPNNKIDRLKLFKIMYFAQMEHLVKYGRLIFVDKFNAYQNGPLPLNLYKLIRDHNTFEGMVTHQNMYLILKEKVNTDNLVYLSDSDIECLDKSFDENYSLSKTELSEKSHDLAWLKAFQKGTQQVLDYIDIAKVGGADENIIQYIEEKYNLV